MKPCTQCKQVKQLTEYHKDRKNPDGHFNLCKICREVPSLFPPRNIQKYQKQAFAEYRKGLSGEERIILSTLYPH